MSAKRKSTFRTSESTDELPVLTKAWFAEADFYDGTRLIRRGRPRVAHPRKLLSLRLPPEVIDKWKATGPGWQTRMAEVLEKAAPSKPRPAAR
jgi:uncharacterized protein (DUF4415 family)